MWSFGKKTAILAATAVMFAGGVAGATASQARTSTTSTQVHKKSTTTTHTTRGVVRSVDQSKLVINRAGKPGGEMTFAMTPSTSRAGRISVGEPVSVRYQNRGSSHFASAVRVEHPAKPMAHPKASKS